MTIIYILSLVFYFPGHSLLISGPKMAENPKILSIMAAQGLENRIKVKAIHFKRGPDNSSDDIYISGQVLYFSGHTACLSGLKLTENP